MNILYLVLSFLFMEFTAWFLHKYVMHGFLWVLHKDHHMPHSAKMEKNDFFAFIFVAPSVLLIITGIDKNFDFKFWIGLGISLYGLSYFLFHEVIVHGRLGNVKKPKFGYLKAVITAHEDHHTSRGNYGFLFMIPWKYFKRT